MYLIKPTECEPPRLTVSQVWLAAISYHFFASSLFPLIPLLCPANPNNRPSVNWKFDMPRFAYGVNALIARFHTYLFLRMVVLPGLPLTFGSSKKFSYVVTYKRTKRELAIAASLAFWQTKQVRGSRGCSMSDRSFHTSDSENGT